MENGSAQKPKRRLVAIVDDEESVRKALKRLMQSAGIGAEAYASGDEFIRSLDSHRPDCVVLDLHMPRMNGFEVQSWLARAGAPLPVVAITGHDTPETRQRVMAAGASAYLRKPVDDKVLLDAVTAAIGGKRA